MTAANFQRSLDLVLASEGGYVNNRADPGGPTNLGVTLATAKRLKIDVDLDGDTDIADIKALTPKDAAKVYRVDYWGTIRGDQLPPGIDYATFDFAVNSGNKRAAQFLQRTLGVEQDGLIGPKTLDAAWAAWLTDPATVIKRLCANRLAWMKRLKTWATFGKGWSRRVADVEKNALAMISNKGT